MDRELSESDALTLLKKDHATKVVCPLNMSGYPRYLATHQFDDGSILTETWLADDDWFTVREFDLRDSTNG